MNVEKPPGAGRAADPAVGLRAVLALRRLAERVEAEQAALARDQRYGPDYSVGATYYDARDEAIRRGDRTVGTEHLVLALLIDPASPAAQALGCDLDSARRALDE